MSKGLVSRRRNVPWIHRWSRFIIGAIAVLGILDTSYLTVTKLASGATVCPTSGCEKVLSSPYATVFGLPVSLFGLLAYVVMAVLALAPLLVKPEANKDLRTNLEKWTWSAMFMLATAMVVFSGYLMYIMVTQFVLPFGVNGLCFYCMASALFALSFFVLTLIGHEWEDAGQLLFTGVLVGMVALIGTLAVYAPIASQRTPTGGDEVTITSGNGQVFFTIKNTSGPAEIELARHLKQIGAKLYVAYWCPHCYEQKELFGKQALKELPYIECAADGVNPQPEKCVAAKIEGFPTWEINGKKVSGTQTLKDLADLSGYQGSRAFKNSF